MESPWGGALAVALRKSSRYPEVKVPGTVEVIPYFSLFPPLLTLLFSRGFSLLRSIHTHPGKAEFLSKGHLLVSLETCKQFKHMAPASYGSQEL